MADPESVLRDSQIDFDSAVAYALQPEMRRLIILAIAGSIILPAGMALFITEPPTIALGVLVRGGGLVLAVVGAAFLFGGGIGALFKLVYDANMLAYRDAE